MGTGDNVLGLSLGSRSVGIAVVVDGELVDWYIKSFKGAWSEEKHNLILDTIERMLERYEVTRFAIKVPQGMERYGHLKALRFDMGLLASNKGISVHGVDIEELKTKSGEIIRNKCQLREVVYKAFPELKVEFRKEIANRNTYYTKLFEALYSILHYSKKKPQ